MSKVSTNRHCWSWRSCFANVKHNKKKSKKQQQKQNCQSNLQKYSSNGHLNKNHSQIVDENSNILNDTDIITKEYNQQLISNDYLIKNENNIDNNYFEQIIEDINLKIINQKLSLTVKPTHLDAIVEDLNEENFDEFEETIQPVKLCCDRELINDSYDLYTRSLDLSKMNHVIIQFNDNGYLLGDFIRHTEKLKHKIDDIKRASTEIPRDAELLEARYSSLLATIESLSLLLKIAQITTLRSFINRLIYSIEERIEQLNKVIQLSSSINLRQQRQDLNDDDFLSFRSALSSYEHLLTIGS